MLQLIHFLSLVYRRLRLRKLKYTMPFIVLAIYTLLGAYIFRNFELKADEDRRAQYRSDTEYAFNEAVRMLLETNFQSQQNWTSSEKTIRMRQTKEALFWFIDYLNLTDVIEERSGASPWTWMTALSYAGQLYTTIGYGFPVAQTAAGRLASILYIMVGIPIFLIILAEVGKILSRALRKMYKRYRSAKIASKIASNTRRMSEPVKAIYNLTAVMASVGGFSTGDFAVTRPYGGAVLTNFKEPTSKMPINSCEAQISSPDNIEQQKEGKKSTTTTFPIPLALLMLIVWILFSAALFCLWETEWGYLTSVYFFFISISTVGLGDIVPTKPDMMFINFFMILIGLALLSMCVNLIQEALERLMERLVEQYIDEIEKIALIINTETEFSDINEYAEELKPLQAEVKLSMRAVNGKPNSFTQTVKDWVAEQASNVLLNRLYPEKFTSSDESSDEDDEHEKRIELEEVVVTGAPTIYSCETVSVTAHRPSLAEHIDLAESVPIISIRECTPSSERDHLKTNKKSQLQKLRTSETCSISSDDRERRKKGRKKKHNHFPFMFRGTSALLSLNQPMLQALQAKSSGKILSVDEKNKEDFKSRLFAKLINNQRLARIVEENSRNSPVQKINSGIQTTPQLSPAEKKVSSEIERKCLITESLDSTTSEQNTLNSGGIIADSFELDSLCCSGYYDLYFGCFSTDSVPRLLAEPNTPIPPTTPDTGRRHCQKLKSFSTELRESRLFHNEMLSSFPICFEDQKRMNHNILRGIQRHAYSTPTTPLTASRSCQLESSTTACSPQMKTRKYQQETSPQASSGILFIRGSRIPVRPRTLKQLAMHHCISNSLTRENPTSAAQVDDRSSARKRKFNGHHSTTPDVFSRRRFSADVGHPSSTAKKITKSPKTRSEDLLETKSSRLKI